MRCLKNLYQWYMGLDPESRRYRKNWIVIYTLNSLLGVSYFIGIPSLHQFVTSSSSPQDPNVQPGLDLSEEWYSWIVGIGSIGEFIGAVLIGVLMKRFYTKHLMLVILFNSAIGGLLYGIGKYGWMLLMGRLLIGIFQGGQMTILRAYLGETCNTVIAMLPPEKQKKSTIKQTTFFLAFAIATISLALGPGLAAIAAQFPGLDQFRWSGYFLLGHSVVLTLVVLVLFRETWDDLSRRKVSWTISKLPIPIYTIVYLLFTFFIMNWYFAVLETLVNPILSDTFGFTIEYISYVFLSTLALVFTGTLTMYVLQRCHLDNRIISLIAYCLFLVGSIIVSDWQAIGGDPCDQFSEKNLATDANSSYVEFNANCSMDLSIFEVNETNSTRDMIYRTSDVNASCICEAFSGPPYHCFWNPNSRITKQYCSRCEPLCRSVDHTLNIFQFIVGIALFGVGYPMGRISLTHIASDIMGAASQGLIMGLMVASGSIARFTGPLWGVVAYVSAGRRTYLAMNILTLLMAIVIIVFLFLYSTFKPKRVNVTSPVETQDTIGAVVYRRNSDQVLLLEDMEDNEHEGQGVCSNESVAETQVSDLSTLIEEDATLL